MFSEQKDLNAIYAAELQVLATKPPKEEAKVNTEQRHEDYYKNFRTNVLLSWTMTNAALAIVILRVGVDGRFVIAQTYMAVMLYTVAGLACELPHHTALTGSFPLLRCGRVPHRAVIHGRVKGKGEV